MISGSKALDALQDCLQVRPWGVEPPRHEHEAARVPWECEWRENCVSAKHGAIRDIINKDFQTTYS